jgi:vacuolar protein sorting-associated protein 33A
MSQFPNAPKRKKHLLSSSDSLFAEIRDKNFAVVGTVLNRVAKKINADYEGRHQAKTPGQLRDFVGKMSSLQADHQALRLRTSAPTVAAS